MRPRRTKNAPPTAPAPEISSSDRDLLTTAYRSGLIVAWKHDRERGYRLTLGGQRDEYVEISHLSSYLQRLRNSVS